MPVLDSWSLISCSTFILACRSTVMKLDVKVLSCGSASPYPCLEHGSVPRRIWPSLGFVGQWRTKQRCLEGFKRSKTLYLDPSKHKKLNQTKPCRF
ncbi:hypothetical protein AUEXF2481DRAFT_615226 [Aureobasidium subglaciale EXF-2481]|uniref:Uncharacterized protein n=1 Tax=Aureobasidium subglaciale (strain EXF-2481) TaxID=1043005 RepID=A0A074YGH3_AURSE|nr:uncharacterized protein AUEXF2481DRAFT_615226 [Aureobasidium subglaciale EXF-2481]KEQ96835.1 hypothetical protein AUEXF2481DRAFT_615226 [Aureobasidium subglaciale EXF-2481]